jgi:hypothetical protein
MTHQFQLSDDIDVEHHFPGDRSVANDASVAWPKIDDAAYHGIAGNIVRTILPHSEADPVALLIQTLVMAGNVIGRAPHFRRSPKRSPATIAVSPATT